MVYGMARQAGGTARLESKVGEGTRVSLFFRRADGEGELPAARTDGAHRDNDRKAQCSVLVIDDDPDVRAFIVSSLEEDGYSVTEAADGQAGLDAFAALAPDVVVLDFLMPGLTGADVARRILAGSPDQKILFVSGYSETDAIRQVAPEAALLVKPFRPAALDAAVRSLMDSPQD
jgi:CheY-like chemotaxis protein